MEGKAKVALTFALYQGDQLVRRDTIAQDIVKVGKDPRISPARRRRSRVAYARGHRGRRTERHHAHRSRQRAGHDGERAARQQVQDPSGRPDPDRVDDDSARERRARGRSGRAPPPTAPSPTPSNRPPQPQMQVNTPTEAIMPAGPDAQLVGQGAATSLGGFGMGRARAVVESVRAAAPAEQPASACAATRSRQQRARLRRATRRRPGTIPSRGRLAVQRRRRGRVEQPVRAREPVRRFGRGAGVRRRLRRQLAGRLGLRSEPAVHVLDDQERPRRPSGRGRGSCGGGRGPRQVGPEHAPRLAREPAEELLRR